MKQTTQTTGDQKTTRAWLNKYGEHNLNQSMRALLKYLANMCYWQQTGKSYKVRRNFEVSLPTLKKNMFCDSLTTAQRYVAEAESMGFITIISSETGGRNAYALHVDQSPYYEGGAKAFKPSKLVGLKKKEERRAAKAAYERKRREQIAQSEIDPPAGSIGLR
jgi:hypothetical protein